MNEKSKRMMGKQHKAINDSLTKVFKLPVYIDEVGENEDGAFDCFHVIYGDFRKMQAVNRLLQDVYVVYVSENNPDVEYTTLDIITVISSINGIEFDRTIKERLQKDDTDSYIDQVTIIFTRKVAYECKV